jgi:hypothetical protein
MLIENLLLIKQAFVQQGLVWVEPYETTEGAINRKEAGMHRGLYYIYPEVNFYFGKAATNTVYNRHQTHRAKLDVDLAKLYGAAKEKKEPKWTFPDGWKDAVCKYIIEDCLAIPSHYTKTPHNTVVPGVLDFAVTHKVNVDNLKVVVWNLDHLTAREISDLEDVIIKSIWPYANAESYRRRRQEFS